MKINNDLAYFLGVFAADGSMYYDTHPRCEISDGTSVEKELKFSYRFMKNIVEILSKNFYIKPKIKRVDNQFVIKFRSIEFAKWLEPFGFNYKRKSKTVTIPRQIKNTKYEKYFWIGVMDSDGMIGRTTKNVTLWSASKRFCLELQEFLLKNNVSSTFHKRINQGREYYYIKIRSPFVRQYSKILGFNHPRKKLWLERHLKKEFYVKNRLNIEPFLLNNKLIDYYRIFNDRVYIIEGEKFINPNKRAFKNRKFKEVFRHLLKKQIHIDNIYLELQECRWKLSKGSTTSIKLPVYFTEDLKEIADFVRITDGGIKISRNYVKSYNKNPKEILKNIERVFCVKPHFTAKKEIIYDSGVLNQLFSKILVRQNGL